MIAIDVNLLLYAFMDDASHHALARDWFEKTLAKAPLVGLPLVSILGFLRISTDRRVSKRALSSGVAGEIVESWLSRDNVTTLVPGAQHWPIFFSLLNDAAASGPRVADVHLAALAIEHGATFYTNDRDYRSFPKLDVRFPLLAQS